VPQSGTRTTEKMEDVYGNGWGRGFGGGDQISIGRKIWTSQGYLELSEGDCPLREPSTMEN
jgi:hypothetical protein